MVELTGDPLVGAGHGFRIKKWLKDLKIVEYVISDDSKISVKGNVFLDEASIKEIPDAFLSNVRFEKVGGFFILCSTKLTSLKICPNEVGGSFICINNPQITSLDDCPLDVGGDFIFYSNGNGSAYNESQVRYKRKIKGKVILEQSKV